MFLIMDESGCLGFDFTKKRTSKYFVITCLFSASKRPLEKLVKKVTKSIPGKRKTSFLHCNKESPAIRKKLLELLLEKECAIIAIYLNKQKVYTKLQDEKHVLYNYVTNILLDRIINEKIFALSGKVELIASRRETNKFLNANFSDYLSRQMETRVDLSVSIKTPSEEKSLQVVDFVSWAIFRKLEFLDESYYEIIKEKVVELSPLFP